LPGRAAPLGSRSRGPLGSQPFGPAATEGRFRLSGQAPHWAIPGGNGSGEEFGAGEALGGSGPGGERKRKGIEILSL